jgi:hypothetical protein
LPSQARGLQRARHAEPRTNGEREVLRQFDTDALVKPGLSPETGGRFVALGLAVRLVEGDCQLTALGRARRLETTR